MLTDNQVYLIAAIGRMFYVLVYLIVEARPVRAYEIAERLQTDKGTIGKYLEELSRLQVAVRTRQGWIATFAGQQLVLPADGGELVLPADGHKAVLPADGHKAVLPVACEPEYVEKTLFSPAEKGGNPENVKIPYFLPGKIWENHKNVKIPYFSPFIIVNSESVFKSKEEEELTITIADASKKTEISRFLGENHNNPAFSDGEHENIDPKLPDSGESARLEGLTEALREAGIKPNHRTRPLFTSDFLTGNHVAGYASRLRGYYGSGYRTNILIGVLESLRPGDSPPERGRSLADILCPQCFCSPCHCGDEVDGADWEEQED